MSLFCDSPGLRIMAAIILANLKVFRRKSLAKEHVCVC